MVPLSLLNQQLSESEDGKEKYNVDKGQLDKPTDFKSIKFDSARRGAPNTQVI